MQINLHDNKKCETCGNRYKDCNLKYYVLIYKFYFCNRNCQKTFDSNFLP